MTTKLTSDRVLAAITRPTPLATPVIASIPQPAQAASGIQAAETLLQRPIAPVATEAASVAAVSFSPDQKRTKRSKSGGGETIDATFDVPTGQATKLITIRCPKDMHARLTILATKNRLGEREGQSLNDLALRAFSHLLETAEAA